MVVSFGLLEDGVIHQTSQGMVCFGAVSLDITSTQGQRPKRHGNDEPRGLFGISRSPRVVAHQSK